MQIHVKLEQTEEVKIGLEKEQLRHNLKRHGEYQKHKKQILLLR
jgi:hypothetical protein